GLADAHAAESKGIVPVPRDDRDVAVNPVAAEADVVCAIADDDGEVVADRDTAQADAVIAVAADDREEAADGGGVADGGGRAGAGLVQADAAADLAPARGESEIARALFEYGAADEGAGQGNVLVAAAREDGEVAADRAP